MADRNHPEQFSEEETKRRADEALKRMLQTPHKPHQPIGKEGKSPAKPKRSRTRRSKSS
jgi:hypothetical protein